jgi:CRP-like cAMP-binding protein
MPPIDRIELLGRTPLFGGLAEPDRRALGTEMREVSYSAGQVIFTRGDAGRDIYLVIEGRVRLSILTAEGRELSFAHAGPGQIFGEIAMLDGGVRSADATAVQRTAAFTLSRGALLRVMQDRPVVGEAMLRFLCGRIREADQQLEAIALYPIEGRLARFFLAAAQQKGGESRQGRLTIDFDMSQSELALLIGASRPKVNTALSMLEAGGALTRKGGRIECDLAELRQIAGLE